MSGDENHGDLLASSSPSAEGSMHGPFPVSKFPQINPLKMGQTSLEMSGLQSPSGMQAMDQRYERPKVDCLNT